MVTRPRVSQTSPVELVSWVLSGRIRFPSFQRSYRWEHEDVTKLFDSVLRGHPIGTLIIWRHPADTDTLRLGPLTIAAEARPDAFWVVDGQQRVISLVGALTAPPETADPRFRIFFDLRENEFVSADRHRQVPEHWFPLPAAMSTAETLAWQRKRPRLTDAELTRCFTVMTAIRDYPIAMYVIEGDDNMGHYTQIFQRINSSGVSLRRDEIDHARRAVSDQADGSDLAMLGSVARRLGFGTIPTRVLAQSILATREDRSRRASLAALSDDERREAVQTAAQALGDAVDFLREEAAIPHVRLLPYPVFLPVLVRFTALFGPPEGRVAELLRRWIWRGSALGMAPRGSTATLRKYSETVKGDPAASVDRLLGMLPPYTTWRPDLNATRLDEAQTKVNLLGMLSRHPRILVQPRGGDDLVGTVADPQGLMEQAGGPLFPITANRGALYETMANRLIHTRDVSVGDIRRALSHEELDPEVLQSHFIDDRGLDLWRRGEKGEFVTHRAALVRTAIAEHVQENALFGFPDGPDPTTLRIPET